MLAAIRTVSQGSRELRARPYNPDALAFEPMLGSGWLAFSKTLAGNCFAPKKALQSSQGSNHVLAGCGSAAAIAPTTVLDLYWRERRQSQRFPAHTVIVILQLTTEIK